MKFAATLTIAAAIAAGLAYATPQILGGTIVPAGHKTYTVGLRNAANNATKCGAVLLTPTKVLTGAQCAPFAHFAAIGTHFNKGTKDGDLVAVKSQTIHPNYDPDTLAFDFNILELESPSKFAPATLSATDAEKFKGATATMLGWGITEDNADAYLSEELRRVDVPVVAMAKCKKMLGLIDPLPSTFFCAGGQEGKDACAGDNGGPLILEKQAGDIVIGLSAGGYGCGKKDTPSFYSKVSSVKKWILQNAPGTVFA